MTRRTRRAALTLAAGSLLALALSGCISYTVGMGAETVAPQERATSNNLSVVPGTLGGSGGSQRTLRTRRPALDTDMRWGLDDQTDMGVRINTYSGVMVTWKRQLTRPDTANEPESRARAALMLGTGVVNMGEHGAVEATLITSAPWTAAGQLYAAARVTQVIPLNADAVRDDPVVGVSVGHLFGDRSMSVGPELGIYYDRSALGLNTSRVLFIPSLVVRRQGIPFMGRR